MLDLVTWSRMLLDGFHSEYWGDMKMNFVKHFFRGYE